MQAPFLADEAFLADVDRARCAADRLHLWWLGQSGFLVAWGGECLLIDPYLSDSLTRKYAQTDKPHVRMTGRVVDPSKLGFAQVATSSHNHTDHLDAETLVPLMRANPALKLVVPSANTAFVAQRLGVDPATLISLDAGEQTRVGHFTMRAVPAAHEALDKDSCGRHCYLGYVFRFGPWTVYHSGDTVLYPGMEDILRPFGIDVAILPINGRGPERRVSGNLWGREAAQLARSIGAALAIPCHYDMFTFNTASPQEFVETARVLGQRIAVLRQGERWTGQR